MVKHDGNTTVQFSPCVILVFIFGCYWML